MIAFNVLANSYFNCYHQKYIGAQVSVQISGLEYAPRDCLLKENLKTFDQW